MGQAACETGSLRLWSYVFPFPNCVEKKEGSLQEEEEKNLLKMEGKDGLGHLCGRRLCLY